jgi:hypothetical protein
VEPLGSAGLCALPLENFLPTRRVRCPEGVAASERAVVVSARPAGYVGPSPGPYQMPVPGYRAPFTSLR